MRVLLVLAALIAAGWYFLKPLPPGKGPKAQTAMRQMAPVIQAAEAYRSANGLYPADLDELVPQFLPGTPRLAQGGSVEYSRLMGRYKLTFSYSDPLPIHCDWRPERPKWECAWF